MVKLTKNNDLYLNNNNNNTCIYFNNTYIYWILDGSLERIIRNFKRTNEAIF